MFNTLCIYLRFTYLIKRQQGETGLSFTSTLPSWTTRARIVPDWSFIWLSHADHRDPSTWAILHCFPECMSRELNQKGNSWDSDRWGCWQCRWQISCLFHGDLVIVITIFLSHWKVHVSGYTVLANIQSLAYFSFFKISIWNTKRERCVHYCTPQMATAPEKPVLGQAKTTSLKLGVWLMWDRGPSTWIIICYFLRWINCNLDQMWAI